MNARVSVVIPARNASQTLGAQLSALTRVCPEQYEIIVVDNASTDNTSAVAARFPRVTVVSCPAVGINTARNVGIRASSGDKVLLCDADDVVASGWCEAMRVALDRFDLVGGRFDWETLNDPFVRATEPNPTEHGLPHFLGTPTAIGANMGFSRRVFDALGGFDEAFVIHYDDTDFCYRAQCLGFTLGFAPDAVVSYRLRSDVRSAARRAANYTRGTAQFRAKHQIRQPWQSKLLRAAHHCKLLVSVLRCRTRLGRWKYARDVGFAIGAVRGYVRYRIVG